MTNPTPRLLDRDQIQRLHDEAERCKEAHKSTSCCEFPSTCGGCHFWSGYIGALEDVLSGQMPNAIMINEAFRNSTWGRAALAKARGEN